MIPTLLEIPLPFTEFALPLHSFGLMMVCAFLAAWRRLQISLVEVGEPGALAEEMVTWAAVGGIVGARFGYIISYPQAFFDAPLATLFGGAGFVFYGGFIGGAFGVWLLLRREGKDFVLFGDLAAPSLAVGYAVGRIGCQLSGDGDYGGPTQLPWGMQYVHGVIPTQPGVLHHPAPVYESLCALLIAFVLVSPKTRRFLPGAGQLFGLYLLLSSAARFLVEYIRIEPRIFGPLTQAQIVAIVISTLGLGLMYSKRNNVKY